MRIIFSCVYLFGTIYFLRRERRLDFFTIGFFSGCFYFLPGLFGFVFTFSRMDLQSLTEEILPQTYFVMTLVLVALLVSSFFFDRKYMTAPVPKMQVPFEGSPEKWATVLAIVGFAMSLVTSGRHLLDQDKAQMLLYLDRWSILWEIGATAGLVLAYASKNRRAFGICTLMLLADCYVGFRVNLILAAISVVVYAQSAKGPIQICRQRRALVLAGLFVTFGFLYQPIGSLAKAGDWGQIKEVIINPDFYAAQFIVSEPFVVQTTLNEVIGTNLHVGPGHLSSLLYVLVPFGNELGGKVVTFNDLFQERLFPGLEFGMAQNIWAQAWSIGGLFVVGIFVLFYVAGVWQGSRGLYSQSKYWRTFSALVFTPWAFYLYRNDLLYQFIMERRILVMFMFVAFIAIILRPAALKVEKFDPPAVSAPHVRP